MIEWLIGWLVVVGMLMDDEAERFPNDTSQWTFVGYVLLMILFWPMVIGIYLNQLRLTFHGKDDQ